jgi:hypothetical protein
MGRTAREMDMYKLSESRGYGEAIECVGVVGYRREVRVLASSWGYRGQFIVGFLTVGGPFIMRLL